jgi:hypothetical protein
MTLPTRMTAHLGLCCSNMMITRTAEQAFVVWFSVDRTAGPTRILQNIMFSVSLHLLSFLVGKGLAFPFRFAYFLSSLGRPPPLISWEGYVCVFMTRDLHDSRNCAMVTTQTSLSHLKLKRLRVVIV